MLHNDGEVEVLAENIALQKFRQRPTKETTFVIDVNFLRHVIKTLLVNHNITTTPQDLDDVLQFFGDVDIRRERQAVRTRSVKKSGVCCSDIDADDVVEIVSKVLVNGVNLVKQMPRFITFLQELGLSI
jgi:hypothetical protein